MRTNGCASEYISLVTQNDICSTMEYDFLNGRKRTFQNPANEVYFTKKKYCE